MYRTLAATLAVLLTSTTAHTAPPPDSPPDAPGLDLAQLQAWEDAGYYDGVGGVLTGWGVAFTSAGLTLLAFGVGSDGGSEHANMFQNFFWLSGSIATAVGAAQLVPGLILRLGHDRPPEAAGPAARAAFEAGGARGAGHVHFGYGALLALGGLALIDHDIGQIMAAVGGVELLWSGWQIYDGRSTMRGLIREARLEAARSRPTAPSAGTHIWPVAHGTF